MKLDGIPNDINVTHDHDVVIQIRVQVDDHTTKNIKDAAITIIAAVTIGSIVKTLTSYGSRSFENWMWKRL